jgi:hypothetical protein
MDDLFHLPLSQQAYEEFIQMELVCKNALNNENGHDIDTWSYRWGNSSFSKKLIKS